nr:translation initiation factor IF-2-like [Aegilops tauschii subsp. strangulata]
MPSRHASLSPFPHCNSAPPPRPDRPLAAQPQAASPLRLPRPAALGRSAPQRRSSSPSPPRRPRRPVPSVPARASSLPRPPRQAAPTPPPAAPPLRAGPPRPTAPAAPRYWVEEWFQYHFVTPENAKKNAVRPPWADIVYMKLHPKTKAEAIAKGFYPCMFARASVVQIKNDLGIDFNPGTAAPKPDGSHEVEQNLIGPFNSFDGLLPHIAAQRATVEEAAGEEEREDVPEPPKPKKKSKASKSIVVPKASSMKPL